jgi:hypothetical protein
VGCAKLKFVNYNATGCFGDRTNKAKWVFSGDGIKSPRRIISRVIYTQFYKFFLGFRPIKLEIASMRNHCNLGAIGTFL